MLALFDHGVPRGIARALQRRFVESSRGRWVRCAAYDGHQSPFPVKSRSRKRAIVIISKNRWSLVRPTMQEIVDAVNAAKPGTCTVVEIPESA
jgi:hypothetical protein